mmetsp:Transcript_23116/g.63376  ORF Transcript_23116/g.63376 Transcript_23116/m.63376 type:complete len:355 (+) Transcript_23116:2263-3327(+)
MIIATEARQLSSCAARAEASLARSASSRPRASIRRRRSSTTARVIAISSWAKRTRAAAERALRVSRSIGLLNGEVRLLTCSRRSSAAGNRATGLPSRTGISNATGAASLQEARASLTRTSASLSLAKWILRATDSSAFSFTASCALVSCAASTREAELRARSTRDSMLFSRRSVAAAMERSSSSLRSSRSKSSRASSTRAISIRLAARGETALSRCSRRRCEAAAIFASRRVAESAAASRCCSLLAATTARARFTTLAFFAALACRMLAARRDDSSTRSEANASFSLRACCIASRACLASSARSSRRRALSWVSRRFSSPLRAPRSAALSSLSSMRSRASCWARRRRSLASRAR